MTRDIAIAIDLNIERNVPLMDIYRDALYRLVPGDEWKVINVAGSFGVSRQHHTDEQFDVLDKLREYFCYDDFKEARKYESSLFDVYGIVPYQGNDEPNPVLIILFKDENTALQFKLMVS